MAATMALTTLVPSTTVPAGAAISLFGSGEGDRTLWLHHTHTGEEGRFTFKRNGKYDQAVLKQLNVFLADWRTKEPTQDGPRPVRSPVGGLPGCRRQAALQHRLVLPLAQDQRDARVQVVRRGR